jgi:hypothetical protein
MDAPPSRAWWAVDAETDSYPTLCAACGVTVQLSATQVVVIEAERIALGDVVQTRTARRRPMHSQPF